MISFYPGPSRVYDTVPTYIKDAYKQGIISVNHRSPEFMQLYHKVKKLLKEKLNVPEDYHVVFTSSATECWEIISQSLISEYCYHFYNGAFGEKWFNYTKKLVPIAMGYKYDMNKMLNLKELDLSSENGVICLTHNETGNGTRISNRRIARIRNSYPNHLIAIDATSSMAGVGLQFENADVWYASVQKCFGLPAGLGVMICSPKAVKRAIDLDENDHYNSLNFLIEQASKNQTSYTPNVLNIYLMGRVLEQVKPIEKIEKKIKKRMKGYRKFFGQFEQLDFLIENNKVRSQTVLTLKADPQLIKKLKEAALKQNILLGNGYGDFKENTFRIANFPALKAKEIDKLKAFFTEYFN